MPQGRVERCSEPQEVLERLRPALLRQPVRGSLMLSLLERRRLEPLPGRYWVASSAGRGFIVSGAELVAEKRTGKQLLSLKPGEEALLIRRVAGDHCAVIGQNRKLLVFPTAQIPEMTKGQGVALQKYKDGGLADVKFFDHATGLSWALGDKIRTETNLTPWLGGRAGAGKLPPSGFPRSGVFGIDGPG